VENIITSPSWERLGAENLQGTLIVIGDSNTGKSTLARYLFQRLAQRGRRVAYLDLDVGQSSLGLPTTLNLGLAAHTRDGVFPPQGQEAAFFVGATSPRGHMLPTLVGAHLLREKGFQWGAEAIVVDTTGLVDQAQGGKALKEWKIELLAPSLVVGLQHSQELEPILWPLRRDRRVRLIELSVSPHVRERPREARIAHRRERLAAYFAQGRSQVVNLRQVAVYDLERLVEGALLAFQDAEGLVLALGVVQEINRTAGSVTVHSPLQAQGEVASVRFGTLRWDLHAKQELRGL
jgi:polynucleotide 5'-hydroxyl-kinase GRC3/NOL9